jgi:putative membrane protein
MENNNRDKGLAISLISTVLGLVVVNYFMPSVHITDTMSAIMLALVLSMLNYFVKPVLKFLSVPMNIMTLGAFNFIINVLVLMLAFHITKGVSIDGFFPAMLASLLLSVLQSFFTKLF